MRPQTHAWWSSIVPRESKSLGQSWHLLCFWTWCMNEDGLHMSECIWSSLIMLFSGLFLLFPVVCCIYVSKFCCRGWSQTESMVNRPWATCWNIFRGFSRQTAPPACFHTSSPWSLLYLCTSRWLSGAWYLRHLFKPNRLRSCSFILLLKEVIFPAWSPSWFLSLTMQFPLWPPSTTALGR